MNSETIKKVYELRNNRILLNNISNIIKLIKSNNYEKIDPIIIRDLINSYDNVNDSLKTKLSSFMENIVDLFIINISRINNVTLNNIYDELEEMVKIINVETQSYNQSPGEKVREKVEQINLRKKLKEEFRNLEDQYLEDGIFLSTHLNKNEERVYTDEWILNNLLTTEGLNIISDTAFTIRTHGVYEKDHQGANYTSHNDERRRML